VYGKFFASTYTGSMMGAGPEVFAVWGYVVANTYDAQVELNPKLLAAILGSDEKTITKAIEYLCSADPNSRSKLENGKRLIREGQFAYRVPTFFIYNKIRNEDERREYNRLKKREQRVRDSKQGVNVRVNDCQAMSAMSAQIEIEIDTDIKDQNLRATTSKKGARIPRDFAVTPEMQAWALTEGLPNPNDHICEFVDYWTAKAGIGGYKLDWQATFRNWLRRVPQYQNGRSSNGSSNGLSKAKQRVVDSRKAIIAGLGYSQEPGPDGADLRSGGPAGTGKSLAKYLPK
jgi:hypothetical protein